MAMKSLVIIPAISNARNMKMSSTTIRPIAYTGDTTGGNGFYSHSINTNVNILLGGAMLSVVVTVVCIVCYCCHRSIRKRTEAAYRQRWMENEANMEIYSVEQCYESSGLFVDSDGLSANNYPIPTMTHEPPPSYDAVVAMSEAIAVQPSTPSVASPPPDYHQQPTDEMHNQQYQEEYQVVPPRFKRKYLPLALRKTSTVSGFYKYFPSRSSTTATNNNNEIPTCCSVSCSSGPRETTFNHDRQQQQQQHHVYHHGCPLCGNLVQQEHTMIITIGPEETREQEEREETEEETRRRMNCDCNENSEMDVEEDVVDSPECLNDNQNNNNVGGGGNGEPSTSAASEATCTYRLDRDTVNGNNNGNLNDNNNGSNTSSILDLDSINDNGIIRLDMSKIIDKTGLPTYEAALKLESSGYV